MQPSKICLHQRNFTFAFYVGDESFLQQIEAERPSSVWYERVSSHSNPGDLPSRIQVKRASQLFSANAESKWVPPTNLVDAIIMLHEKPYSVVHTLFKGEQTNATNTKKG